MVLKDREPITVRPGELLEPVDFNAVKELLFNKLERPVNSQEILAYTLYPKVFDEYCATEKNFGDVSVLDTPTFLYGMRLGEEIEVEIEVGKTLIIKLVSISKPDKEGNRIIYFELNGQPREITIQDMNMEVSSFSKLKAEPSNESHIGATMPGTVLKVEVATGDEVRRGQHLIITEAMKMETTVQAPFDGIVKAIHVGAGEAIATGDLLIEMEK